MKKFKNVRSYEGAMRFFKESGFKPVFDSHQALNKIDTKASVYLVHYLLDNAKNSAVRAAIHKFFNCMAFHETKGDHDFIGLQNYYFDENSKVDVIQLREFSGHNGDESVLLEEYKKFEF